jgi:hypothetical protein
VKIKVDWIIVGATVLMTSSLIISRRPTGRGMSNPPEEPKPKSLSTFNEATPSTTKSQRALFYAGNRFLKRGDFKAARKMYRVLLEELPGNEIVLHNLRLCKLGE